MATLALKTGRNRSTASPARIAWEALAFLLVALLLRASTFGDPNLHDDEIFYQTVGIAMHHGAVPYVDVWDRKPWGLFFLYYLIAFLSEGPLAYQLVATLFAAATAWVIARLADAWARPPGGLLAGMAYLLWLERMQGFGGQTPIFYNLFVATAALLIYRARTGLREGRVPRSVPTAMLLAGVAITIKPTAAFEAAFLGLYASALLLRSARPSGRTWASIASWIAIGAAPILAISAWYALHGYWAIYWHAMATSNADKMISLPSGGIRALITFVFLAPLLAVMALAFASLRGDARLFLALWLLAALAGLCSVPNFYMHYSLPILVPMAAASAAFLEKRLAGPMALAFFALFAMQDTMVFDFDHAQRSRRSMDELAASVRAHDDGPLFVFDGPPQLYPLTGHRFPTPLVFPHHLYHLIEKDVSHLSTLAEVRRVLAQRPGVVVTAPEPRQGPANLETLDLVNNYIHAHCHKVLDVDSPQWLTTSRMQVWADCRKPR